MTIRGLVVAAAMYFACAGSAMAYEREANTPSGRPEMVFAYTDLNEAVSKVSSGCMDKGWMVTSQTNNQVVCEIPMGFWQSAFTQMLIGNQYSTDPKQFVRISLTQVGDHTRAMTQNWVETQMAFGQIQHQQQTGDNFINAMMGYLAASGAQFPVGTTFTSAAYLGLDSDPSTWQNGRRTQYGEAVTSITPGAPADDMGVALGDVITKINGRTFRDEAGLINLLGRQRVGEAWNITVMRGAEELTFNGVAEGRPTITALVDPDTLQADVHPVAAQMLIALGQPVPLIEVKKAQAEPQETELDRMRREAAEAQARLAAAEQAATKKGAEPVTDPA